MVRYQKAIVNKQPWGGHSSFIAWPLLIVATDAAAAAAAAAGKTNQEENQTNQRTESNQATKQNS